MAIVPLFGHAHERERLTTAADAGTLPASLLLCGPRGVGKQRLALWLAQRMLCTASGARPCGVCEACRLNLSVRHPDVYWFYPRPRLKDADASVADALDDYNAATQARVEQYGLYPRPSGSDGIHVVTVRAIVQRASLSPALARRKVFVIGDAERMVSQEGADQAANAFLKLLEEPPADTTLILTSSEPGALLPTIRSRVVPMRVRPLGETDVRAFLADEAVRGELDRAGVPAGEATRVTLAGGAPGTLFTRAAREAARTAAARLLDTVRAAPADRHAAALAQGVAGARGAFSDTLSALVELLRERAADALARGDMARAYAASRAVPAVAQAQARADGNVNPQLVAAALLRTLAEVGA